MSFWKLLLVPVTVMLVALAYTAGALTGAPTPPQEQPPIVLQDVGGQASPTKTPSEGTDAPREPRPDGGEPFEATREDPPEAEEDDDDDDDDDVRVVIPEPTEVHDEDDEDDDRDDSD